MKLKKAFDMIANGVVQEEKLKREKAPKEALNKNWLPIVNFIRTSYM